MSDIQPAGALTPFDSIRHTDEQGREYWSARELGAALGYDKWQNFIGIVRAARSIYASQNESLEGVFTAISKNPTKSGGRPSAEYDFHLSRHACYLTAMSAEGSKPEVAAAKTYFAIKTQEREQIEKEMLLALARELEDNPLAEVVRRIALRQELTDANRELLKRAEQAGVITPIQRAVFMNWGYQGLYAGEVEDAVHERKELEEREKISSWMGAVETMANVLRAVIARGRMDRQGVDNPTDANYTHYLSGKRVREFLLSEGIYPEQLPTPTKSYREIVKEEAARIAEEERQEALDEQYRTGLWGQLPQGGD